MTRAEVYKLIDGEREYQNELGPDRWEGKPHSPGAYITMLTSYLTKAQQAWTDNAGDKESLGVIRKIAAIAVRCMEDHGAPPRAH